MDIGNNRSMSHCGYHDLSNLKCDLFLSKRCIQQESSSKKKRRKGKIKRTAHGYIAFPLHSQKPEKKKRSSSLSSTSLLPCSNPLERHQKSNSKRNGLRTPCRGSSCALRLCAVLLMCVVGRVEGRFGQWRRRLQTLLSSR
jgi:hypothetical protein